MPEHRVNSIYITELPARIGGQPCFGRINCYCDWFATATGPRADSVNDELWQMWRQHESDVVAQAVYDLNRSSVDD